jgi:hypothetical protein
VIEESNVMIVISRLAPRSGKNMDNQTIDIDEIKSSKKEEYYITANDYYYYTRCSFR